MKKCRRLVSYQLHLYWKTNKWIMPLVVWLISLVASYSVKPIYVVSSTLISAGILFFIGLWMGSSFYDHIDPVEEQITILKVQSSTRYHVCQGISLTILNLVLSLIGVIYPILVNASNGFTFYTRSVVGIDYIASLILHLCLCMLGMSVSMLCQPRLIKNRKSAVLLMACIGILVISKQGIVESAPLLKYIVWVLPPVSDILSLSGKKDFFDGVNIAISFGGTLIYTCILSWIVQFCLKRNNHY